MKDDESRSAQGPWEALEAGFCTFSLSETSRESGLSDSMTRMFFIVGPTASGKSELAGELAGEMGAEIVSADAFQIYRGLDLLSAKPNAATLAKAPHHLIGTIPLSEKMDAEKFRRAASRAVDEINSRGKLAIVVGGSGLYIWALRSQKQKA
jgi:tRNA dimethylallyltransferase